jgi:hypothetical protein
MKADTTASAVTHAALYDLPVSGLWIEFLDERGHTLARHVVDEWHGRPVPARGDRFEVSDIIGVRRHQGVVVVRREELQHTPEGEPRLWVQLTVRVMTHPALSAGRIAATTMNGSYELMASRN